MRTIGVSPVVQRPMLIAAVATATPGNATIPANLRASLRRSRRHGCDEMRSSVITATPPRMAVYFAPIAKMRASIVV